MKQSLLVTIVFITVMSLAGCQGFLLKKKPSAPTPEDLQAVRASLERAEHPQDFADPLESEQHYLQALETLDSLSLEYGQDSTISAWYGRISESYNDYLDQLLSQETDTLTTAWVLEDLERIYAEEIDSSAAIPDTLAEHKIPIVLNRKVERAIQYFSKGRGRGVFKRWLQRAGRYEKLVKSILREENAPEELFYLAMIESGLNPTARSYARAVGMWQFIYGTGKAYGLQRDWWFDDRKDPLKATRAAARHLLDLYERFGDWYLAIAGYNFNPRKIEKRLERYQVSEFWDLPRLPRQTRNYVPTYLAAVTIASDPGKYGFSDITPEPPLQFDTLTVKECLDLNVVAETIGSSFQELKTLNPALLRWCTPPDAERWTLYLPPGGRETLLAKYDQIPKEKKMKWVRHRIRSGETLSTIARRYGVSMSEIKRFNKIRGSLIRAGHSLVIPIPQNKSYYKKYTAAAPARSSKPKSPPVKNVPGREKREYVVKKGDSLWEVAQRFSVSVNELRRWNGLGYTRLIKPGQTLNVWLLPGSSAPVPEEQPVLAKAELPKPGALAPVSPPSRTPGPTIHKVRSGDTLWDIAQTYKVSIRDLKRWNGKRSNKIKPGEELKILYD